MGLMSSSKSGMAYTVSLLEDRKEKEGACMRVCDALYCCIPAAHPNAPCPQRSMPERANPCPTKSSSAGPRWTRRMYLHRCRWTTEQGTTWQPCRCTTLHPVAAGQVKFQMKMWLGSRIGKETRTTFAFTFTFWRNIAVVCSLCPTALDDLVLEQSTHAR
jgi:hypothetical protein